MTEKQFWEIISFFNWKKTGDDDAVIKPAVVALSKMGVEDIIQFENLLAEKLFALDTKAHAREIGEYAYQSDDKPFSVDWFLYSRCCVVANGEQYYLRALADPKRMAKDKEFEAILSVAREAYQKKTHKEFDNHSSINYETFSNKNGWQ
jgi:hypothetical protein